MIPPPPPHNPFATSCTVINTPCVCVCVWRVLLSFNRTALTLYNTRTHVLLHVVFRRPFIKAYYMILYKYYIIILACNEYYVYIYTCVCNTRASYHRCRISVDKTTYEKKNRIEKNFFTRYYNNTFIPSLWFCARPFERAAAVSPHSFAMRIINGPWIQSVPRSPSY